MNVSITWLAVTIGGVTITWQGISIGIAVLAGFYLFVRTAHGRDCRGEASDVGLAAIVGGILGGWSTHAALNWYASYAHNLAALLQVVPGKLSFDGAIVGGTLVAAWYSQRRGIRFYRYADAAVGGLSIGIIIAQLGFVFGFDMLGRPAAALPWGRHPVQLYGALIGVLLLIADLWFARRASVRPEGEEFWLFIASYTFLKALFQEPFRVLPLYLWGSVNTQWGIGLLTLHQLFTPVVVLAAAWMVRGLILAQKRATVPSDSHVRKEVG